MYVLRTGCCTLCTPAVYGVCLAVYSSCTLLYTDYRVHDLGRMGHGACVAKIPARGARSVSGRPIGYPTYRFYSSRTEQEDRATGKEPRESYCKARETARQGTVAAVSQHYVRGFGFVRVQGGYVVS